MGNIVIVKVSFPNANAGETVCRVLTYHSVKAPHRGETTAGGETTPVSFHQSIVVDVDLL